MNFKKGDIICHTKTRWLGIFSHYGTTGSNKDIRGTYIYPGSRNYPPRIHLHWPERSTRLATPEEIAKVMTRKLMVCLWNLK